jgi:hypothetical protein
MTSLRTHTGSGTTSSHVHALAGSLAEQLSPATHLITGLVLAGAGKRRLLLDLVIVTPTAVFTGTASEPPAGPPVPPKQAAQLVADHIQKLRLVDRPLPVYAFWLGQQRPAGQEDNLPLLSEAAAVQALISQITTDTPPLAEETIAAIAGGLLKQDLGPLRKTPPLRRALRRLGRLPGRVDAGLQEFIRQPPFLHGKNPIRPADVNRYLQQALLNSDNHLEDVDYRKIVPNDYLVELNPENYERHYRPVARQVCDGWQLRLLQALETANGRMGRKEFRFAGPVRVQVRPAEGLAAGEVQIRCRVHTEPQPEPGTDHDDPACLQLWQNGRVWPLSPGITTIGRDAACHIRLQDASIQAKRLVSGQHAYIVSDTRRGTTGGGVKYAREYYLFDGSPEGKASTNGVFVNGRRLTSEGQLLQDGDQIILATLDPHNPQPDTPGVATFIFHRHCPRQS